MQVTDVDYLYAHLMTSESHQHLAMTIEHPQPLNSGVQAKANELEPRQPSKVPRKKAQERPKTEMADKDKPMSQG